MNLNVKTTITPAHTLARTLTCALALTLTLALALTLVLTLTLTLGHLDVKATIIESRQGVMGVYNVIRGAWGVGAVGVGQGRWLVKVWCQLSA